MKIEYGSTYIYAIDEDTNEEIILGTEAELLSDWQEACARNNENRSFEAWLESKAKLIIE